MRYLLAIAVIVLGQLVYPKYSAGAFLGLACGFTLGAMFIRDEVDRRLRGRTW